MQSHSSASAVTPFSCAALGDERVSGEGCAVCAESMQQQTRWRKSVRAVIALNSMRENRKAPSVASADEEREEPGDPPPGDYPLHVT